MAWIEFLDRSKEKWATKTAIIDQNTGLSFNYQALWEESHRWSTWLKDQGVKRGDRVAYLNSNSLEHLTMFFGAARLGALFVPLNFRLAESELDEILDRIEPKVFIGKEPCDLGKNYNKFDLNTINLPTFEKITNEESSLEYDPLLMLFTSGTTGTPKGVMFHGKMLETNQIETSKNWGLVSDDRCLVETPFFHTGGYNVLALPLLALGGTILLANKFDVDNVLKTIEQDRISVYFGVPTMFQMMSEDPRFHTTDFRSIRFFISGGAYCPVELIEEFQKKNLMFKQGFGLTEVGPNCFLLHEKDAIRKVGSIGQPMPHSKVLLIKDDGTLAQNDEVGELLIAGDHVCLGYYNQEKRFQDCLFDGHFKTGDLAKKDQDGFYFIVGRKKDMYISGGENVYPAEVEKKMISHEAIHEAVVLPVPSDRWGEVGYAIIRSDFEISIEEMREFLNPLLSRYKHPHFIAKIDQFPLLASGKIDRKSLAEQLAGSEGRQL